MDYIMVSHLKTGFVIAVLMLSVPLMSSCSLSSVSLAIPLQEEVPVSDYRVVRSFSHNTGAFTQGLVFYEGKLYESTGQYGSSSLRQVELETGFVVQIKQIAPDRFGEGIAVIGDRVFMVTWRSHTGFIFDRESFAVLGEFSYSGEGWGLTCDGERLIMSDGTSTLRYLDPVTFQETGTVTVTLGGTPLLNLNELEYVQGEIWANVWRADRIARISPETGQVIGWIDLTGLLNPGDWTESVDVLNGIAFDSETGRIFVTGKLWPQLFEIELIPAE